MSGTISAIITRQEAKANIEKLATSKQEAKQRGDGYYVTASCIHGHSPSIRDTKGSRCIYCSIPLKKKSYDKVGRDTRKTWRESNAEKVSINRKKHYYNNKDHAHQLRVSWHQQKKIEAMAAYGGECDVCGETDVDVLTMDHVQGGGAEHRVEIGGAARTYKWLQDNGYPLSFRVLCFNCNFKSHLILKRTGAPLETVRSLQRSITRWADRVYPDRTSAVTLLKLQDEVKEMIDTLDGGKDVDIHEFADVIILLLDVASLNGVDVSKALREKLEINSLREWEFDFRGVMSHVRKTRTG